MRVSYKLYSKKRKDQDRLLSKLNETNCFSDTFNRSWDYIILKIKTVESTIEYKEQWLNLLLQIETKSEIIIDEDFGESIKVPYLKSKGKTLFFLTLVRYLWENDNNYDQIVPMTIRFLEKYPNTDILKAIVICASNTSRAFGWGHSIVVAVANKLPNVWHYRRFNSELCNHLCNPEGIYAVNVKNKKTLDKIRKEKEYEFDFKPILKHYNLSYE